MEDDPFEEWGPDLLDHLIQLEEKIISTQTKTLPQPPPCSRDNAVNFSYSPPRELTQRTHDNAPLNRSQNGISISESLSSSGPSDHERQIEHLKGQLECVRKQLSGREQECFELRKERDKLRSVYSRNEEKDADEHSSQRLKKTKSADAQLVSRINIATSTCKAVGVQTEEAESCSNLTLNEGISVSHDLSKNLRTIWGSSGDQNSGRNLISKLFAACPTDFHVLFGCLRTTTTSKLALNHLPSSSNHDLVLAHDIPSVSTSEAAKVSRLYSALTKISSGMARLEVLVEPLLDLCRLQSIVIAHRSLRVLHAVLKHFLSFERKTEGRDNVLIEGLHYRNRIVDLNGLEGTSCRWPFPMNMDKTSSAGHSPLQLGFPEVEIIGKRCYNPGTAMSVFSVDWLSLFEVMRQVAMKNEECIRVEAVSIMILIIMRSNAYMEREKFGQTLVYRSVSLLLKKESGILVQTKAVQLLYLLLNCPKILAIFCSSCKGDGNTDAAKDNVGSAFVQEFGMILEGLADCLANCGIGTEDLRLRRNAINGLAFIASSGKSGLDILLGYKLSRGVNFLMLVLQVLVSEIDAEAMAACPISPEVSKERTLLMRESLILLNRLVSSPAHSAVVMRELTNGRHMASLTINIASRLSWKEQRLGQPDSMTRQIRESEVLDLARVFKKRVFSYVGDKVS